MKLASLGATPDWSEVLASELYDLDTDPDETINMLSREPNEDLRRLQGLLSQTLRAKVNNKRTSVDVEDLRISPFQDVGESHSLGKLIDLMLILAGAILGWLVISRLSTTSVSIPGNKQNTS